MNRALKIITAILLFMVFIVSCNNSKPTNNDVNSSVQNACVVDKAEDRNNHNYVDFGLPSGTLWATCNVGADSPEEFGDYYSWGETTAKTTYNWKNYMYCEGDYTRLTKYCSSAQYGYAGFVDYQSTLQPNDDAATVNWGSEWCTPTKKQWEELIQHTVVTHKIQNGVRGLLITAKNGNSIFLPSAVEMYGAGRYGVYWSSSLTMDVPSYAWYLFFSSNDSFVANGSRCDGLSVRPVRSTN